MNLDIYVVSSARDKATIERFLDDYVDRGTSQDRGDEELMMLPLGATEEPARLEDWDWEPAVDLDHIIKRGLEKPARAFTVYLQAHDRSLSGAIIAFTTDGRIIFGLSVDDSAIMPENTTRAKLLLHQMAAAYRGESGWISVASPPPIITGQTMRERVVYDWLAD